MKSIIKIITKDIKNLQSELLTAKKEESSMGMYEDCGQFYTDQVTELKAKIEVLIQTKIKVEKHIKWLKHNDT